MHVDLGFECPIDLHCTYTRDQILVAMNYGIYQVSCRINFYSTYYKTLGYNDISRFAIDMEPLSIWLLCLRAYYIESPAL